MKLTHGWKTQSGLNVTATCELTLKENSFADGWNVEVDVCKKSLKIEVEGMGVVGTYINRQSQKMGGTTYPATCGKMVIAQDNLDAIDAMTAKIESHPAWIAKEAKEAQNLKDSVEYEKHCDKMRKAMGGY